MSVRKELALPVFWLARSKTDNDLDQPFCLPSFLPAPVISFRWNDMLDCEFFVVPFGVSVAFFPDCTIFPALPAEVVYADCTWQVQELL